MPTDPEQLLQEAVQMHSASKFDKGLKKAEEARKLFLKRGQNERAIEALRVMADCALNARDFSRAGKLYEELRRDAVGTASPLYQSAAQWGFGQMALRKMDYPLAVGAFQAGLDLGKKAASKWYTAWNALGLATAYRGTGRIADAQTLLKAAASDFHAIDQSNFASWAEKALADIGGDSSSPPTKDMKIWLCPMCAAKLPPAEAERVRKGKLATCTYCGTSIG